MRFNVEIQVTPREGIVDPEGHTIGQALGNLGYEGAVKSRWTNSRCATIWTV